MEHRIDAVVPLRPVTGQRVGDLERSTVCDELAGHFAAGRISSDELEQRLEAAVAARTQRDLRLLVFDLPAGPPPAGPPPAGPAVARSAPPANGWSLADGVVLVALIGTVVLIGCLMLGLALAGEPAMFFGAVLGGSLAAAAGAGLTHLVHRAGRRSGRD